MKIVGIYTIRNLISGRLYVGSSVDVVGRLRSHRSRLSAGTHHCAHLQMAWNKEGAGVFSFSILEEMPPEALRANEQALLDTVPYLYNTAKSVAQPALGRRLSPEACAKISAAGKGKPKSVEHRAKIGQAHKGRIVTPVTREKLRAIRAGQQLSDSHRANIALSLIGNTRTRGSQLTTDHKARISERVRAHFNQHPRTAENRARASAALKGRQHSTGHHSKAWQTRRALYGPSGRRPGKREEVAL